VKEPDDLYSKVVSITSDYLGPAAERFIDRQVRNHLKKPPEKIINDDLDSLINWIRASISILSEDMELVEEYTSRLKAAADNTEGA
jgi:hypothetical protein